MQIPVHTSSFPVAEIGESPDITEAHGVGHAGHDEVQLATPVASLRLLPAAGGTRVRGHRDLLTNFRLERDAEKQVKIRNPATPPQTHTKKNFRL